MGTQVCGIVAPEFFLSACPDYLVAKVTQTIRLNHITAARTWGRKFWTIRSGNAFELW